MRWRRETLRMMLYMGIPCVAFTMANLPFASETNIHSIRLSYFKRTGVDPFPKEPDDTTRWVATFSMKDCNETSCKFEAGSRISGQMKFDLVEKADKLGSRLTLETPAGLETVMESENICPTTSPQCPLLAGIPYTYNFSAIVPDKP
ncbi:hypothetical protein X801_06970, partial [Opisthorchis viverrini]